MQRDRAHHPQPADQGSQSPGEDPEGENMTTATMPTPLRDVLYAFSLAKPIPDADLLEEFTRRYPEHAIELTDFAIELAVDAMRGHEDAEPDLVDDAVSPAVSRAMSAFQNRLFEVRNVD